MTIKVIFREFTGEPREITAEGIGAVITDRGIIHGGTGHPYYFYEGKRRGKGVRSGLLYNRNARLSLEFPLFTLTDGSIPGDKYNFPLVESFVHIPDKENLSGFHRLRI